MVHACMIRLLNLRSAKHSIPPKIYIEMIIMRVKNVTLVERKDKIKYVRINEWIKEEP